MKRTQFLLTAGCDLCFCASLAFSVLLVGNAWFGAGWHPLALFVCVFAFSAPAQFCRPKVCACIFGAAAVATGVIGLVLLAGKQSLTVYAQVVQMLGASCAVVCCVAVTQRHLWLKSALILFTFAVMLALSAYRVPLERTAVYTLLICVAVVLTQWTARKTSSAGQAGTGYLFYVFAVLLLPLLWLPAAKTPMQWTAIKQALQTIGDAASSIMLDVTSLFSADDATAAIGFSEGGLLGGDIGGTGRVALTLSGNRTHGALYLSGAAYDTYTGQSWLRTQKERTYAPEEYLAQYDSLCAALERSRYSESEKESMIHRCNYVVEYKYIKTKSVFLAPVSSLLSWEKKEALEQKTDCLSLQKPKKTGFGYRMYFTEVNWESDLLQELLRGNAWHSEPKLTLEEQKRQTYVAQTYLNLPQSLPSAVRQLAQQLTTGCTNDYDKLRAIQAYVRQYTYTKTPGNTPEGADFASYFLFESQQGYCTHFATAMTVLARCAGIPARYVTGFVASDTAMQHHTPVSVREQQAHAWVEAYVEPVGWVPFDPSPASGSGIANRPWVQAVSGSSAAAQDEAPILPVQGNAQKADPAAQTANVSPWAKLLQALLYAAKSAVVLVCIAAFVVGLRAGVRTFLYQRKTNRCKAEYWMRYLLAFGKKYGCKRQDADTLEAYSLQLNGRMDTDEASFDKVCHLYQEARFGANDVSSACVAFMERYTKALRKQYIAQCSVVKKLLFLMQ